MDAHHKTLLLFFGLVIILSGCHASKQNTGGYPKPYSPITNVRFIINDTLPVTLVVYNVAGQVIDTLVNEIKPPGEYDIKWNPPPDISWGVYPYKLDVGDSASVKWGKFIK
jgi:hypothetical protein